jgi:hypothetical protein
MRWGVLGWVLSFRDLSCRFGCGCSGRVGSFRVRVVSARLGSASRQFQFQYQYLGCVGFGLVGFDWVGLDWGEVEWAGLNLARMIWDVFGWAGLSRTLLGWARLFCSWLDKAVLCMACLVWFRVCVRLEFDRVLLVFRFVLGCLKLGYVRLGYDMLG